MSESDNTVSCQDLANATLSEVKYAETFMKERAEEIVKNVSTLLIFDPVSR